MRKKMSDRLHEIIAEIGVIHKDLINDGKIDDIEYVFEYIENYVVFFKDTNYEEPLKSMYEYYINGDDELKVILEETVELIKRNRYVCAYAFKNQQQDFARFFLNEDLLESLKRDLPYLLK
jgi:ribosome biogenesis GTPase A